MLKALFSCAKRLLGFLTVLRLVAVAVVALRLVAVAVVAFRLGAVVFVAVLRLGAVVVDVVLCFKTLRFAAPPSWLVIGTSDVIWLYNIHGFNSVSRLQ